MTFVIPSCKPLYSAQLTVEVKQDHDEKSFATLLMNLIHMQPHQWFEVHLNESYWTVEMRPHYCNRGRYLWKCSSTSVYLVVDDAQLFPRFYFQSQGMIAEMLSWCEARTQAIKEVSTLQ